MVWPSTALNAVEGSRPFVNKLREYLQFYRKRFLFFVAEQTALTATTASAFAKAFCERRGKSFSLAWNEKWKKERWNSSLSPWPLERYTGRKEKGKLILAGAYFSSHTHIYIYIYIYITHNVVKKKGNNRRTIYLVNTSSEIPSMQIVFKVDFLSLSEWDQNSLSILKDMQPTSTLLD